MVQEQKIILVQKSSSKFRYFITYAFDKEMKTEGDSCCDFPYLNLSLYDYYIL